MQPLFALLPVAKDNTLVRTMHMADWEGFHSYRCDDELARYQGWSPMTQNEARAFVQEMSAAPALRPGSWIQLAIAEPTSNRILGDVGLYLEPDASTAEIGFTLSRAAQGRGHAARAVGLSLSLVFAASSVPFVRAVTDARNASSVRVLEQTRFAKASTQQTMFKGEPCTELVYVFRRADA